VSGNPVVIVIEDDPQMRRFLRTSLRAQSFTVFEAETGRRGLIEAGTRKPELIIVDLGLPDMDGVEVVRALRGWTNLPIIILSARTTEQHKIEALDAGADDYLTKPFSLGELLARIRVALRHSAANPQSGESDVFSTGDLTVDLLKRHVILAGNPVHLTPIQYRLLAMLVKHAGRVLTHRQILSEVWGPAYLDNPHYLRVYMSQLRQKLEADPTQPRYLLTESGVGYRLQA
jgi:two-component system, OmpR family, KDP operon response regulator KdpE